MPVTLGRDGKINALATNLAPQSGPTGTIYLGLLGSFTEDFSFMPLHDLVNYELDFEANFYTGRKIISFDTDGITIDEHGHASVQNDNAMSEWLNTTGADRFVAGFFITDASSGFGGQALWVGTPNIGIMTIRNNKSLRYESGTFTLRVN